MSCPRLVNFLTSRFMRGLPALLMTIIFVSQIACSPGNSSVPEALKNILLEKPVTVKHFALTAQDGSVFSEKELYNRWTLMFFGYTHCPDICPTTLTELAELAKLLPRDSLPQIVFVSVDPQRDTPEHLKGYMRFFNEHFLGLTGQAEAISKLTKQLNVKYSLEPAIDGNYAVNHSSSIFLIDPQGRYTASFQAPHYAETIQTQFEHIKQFVNTKPKA
jgi:cytochrome oxidase Cu insertion factor (SCO1/SenC/PrrC family)